MSRLTKKVSAIRLALVLVIVSALVSVGAAAYAQQGTGDAGDPASVTVYNVYAWDRTLGSGQSSLTVDVDCHSGDTVITGYGALYHSMSQTFGGINQGSALDSDTWRVTFTFGAGARTIMQVNATCLEAN